MYGESEKPDVRTGTHKTFSVHLLLQCARGCGYTVLDMNGLGKLTLILLAGCAVLAAQEEAPKPACTSENAGAFWPDEANTDPRLAAKLSHCGKLEICTRTTWKYHWKSPTVSVEQLRKGSTAKAASTCSPEVATKEMKMPVQAPPEQ
jgi:hypothetical protein